MDGAIAPNVHPVFTASVAQLAEHRIVVPRVVGSNPIVRPMISVIHIPQRAGFLVAIKCKQADLEVCFANVMQIFQGRRYRRSRNVPAREATQVIGRSSGMSDDEATGRH